MPATLEATTTDRWMTEPMLREYLSVSRSTMQRWRAAGMPCAGDYQLRRYHLASILAWLDARGWKVTS